MMQMNINADSYYQNCTKMRIASALTIFIGAAMCPPSRCERVFAGAGQELNIAQHARRQAARKAASAPRFFC
jgi:hypothetical protein